MTRTLLEQSLRQLQDELLLVGDEVAQHIVRAADSLCRRDLEAFVRRDAAIAQAIALDDDAVDALFQRLYQAILQLVATAPTSVDHAHQLEWAAHNLERAADRVINICEWVVYMVTGD